MLVLWHNAHVYSFRFLGIALLFVCIGRGPVQPCSSIRTKMKFSAFIMIIFYSSNLCIHNEILNLDYEYLLLKFWMHQLGKGESLHMRGPARCKGKLKNTFLESLWGKHGPLWVLRVARWFAKIPNR